MLTRVKSIQVIDPLHALFIMEGKEIAEESLPGQFVEVRVAKGFNPLMRKPLSIFCTEGDTFGLLVKTDGYGAQIMLHWHVGEEIDIIGPLGNGFKYADSDGDFVLAGGGIGVAPMNMLAQELVKQGKRVHMLFSPKRDAEVLKALTVSDGVSIHFAENRNTLAADLKALIGSLENPCDVYACGPNAFLKCVSDTAAECGLRAQVSLETRMSCGMGACLGCVVNIREGDEIVYKTVCHDGPVFYGEEVVFE